MRYLFVVFEIKENRGILFSKVQQGIKRKTDGDIDGEGVFVQSALVGYRL